MEKENNINHQLYSMKLHDTMSVQSNFMEWHITRVPSGWIYVYARLDAGQMNSVFVPFDNHFQAPNPTNNG